MRAYVIVLSSLLSAGCLIDRSGTTTVTPPDPDASIPDAMTAAMDAGDAAVRRDAAPIMDAPPDTDASLADAPLPDPDAALPDAGDVLDAGTEDASLADADIPDTGTEPMDAGAPDAGLPDSGDPDAGPPDAGRPDAGSPDASVTDAGTDAGPPVGCADDSVEQRYMDGAGELVMAGCDGAQDQCTAELLCAPGWHLCTQGEYGVRGGDADPTSTPRWLAGCVRRGNCTATGGSSAICGDCSVESGPLAVFGNSCGGGMRVEADICPVGVTASAAATRYRIDGHPDCLHAETARTDALLGATCCR